MLLDRPVYLDPDRREKAKLPKKPGAKDEDDNAKVDTVMCFHAPKDDDAPRPKMIQPVTAVEESREGDRPEGKLYKFQSIQAPELVMVNTPLPNKKQRHDVDATASGTMPGTFAFGRRVRRTRTVRHRRKRRRRKKESPRRRRHARKANSVLTKK